MRKASSFSLFLGVYAILLVAALVVVNAWMPPWSGAEVRFLSRLLGSGPAEHLPAGLTRPLLHDISKLFWIRLPGIILFMGTLAWIVFAGRALFGARVAWLSVMVCAGSWVLLFLAKVATADMWLFAFHAGGVLALLRFIKKPAPFWRYSFYGFVALGLLTATMSSLILFLVFAQMLYIFHPQGKRVATLHPWGVAPGLTLIFHFLGWTAWAPSDMYFNFHPLRLFTGSLLGSLPFIPFLAAGLWEIVKRMRKGEELSIIHSSLIMAAILGQSLVILLSFALIIARQMSVYFKKGYPYRGLVRVIAILHLLGVFFMVTLLLVGGFAQFGGVGFRAILTPGAVYWMLSFISVLGLFGMNRRQVQGGILGSGLLSFLAFWIAAYPLWHNGRLWPENTLKTALEMGYAPPGDTLRILASQAVREKLSLYAREASLPISELDDSLSLQRLLEEDAPGIYVIQPEFDLPEESQSTLVEGRRDNFELLELRVLKRTGSER